MDDLNKDLREAYRSLYDQKMLKVTCIQTISLKRAQLSKQYRLLSNYCNCNDCDCISSR